MTFPQTRPRRLRENPILRRMVRETTLAPEHLIYPVFVQEGTSIRTEIGSMPGQFRYSPDQLDFAAETLAAQGVRSLLLFGLPAAKDPEGSGAWKEDGIVQQAARRLKEKGFPFLIVADVCLCEYTSHGHCGLLRDDRIDNDATLPLLARTALSLAQAGADLIAPSDMMDGRVKVIRETLDGAGYAHLPIMSYSVKYASAFYGPFRDAANSAPAFGDRRSHQMDPANALEAIREAEADLEEGADILMVKPALAYLDVIRRLKERFPVPLAAYAVSGEYAMIEAAAQRGWINRDRILYESITAIRRAGADLVISYHTPRILDLLRQGDWPPLA